MLAQAESRVMTVGQNLANAATTGYRRQVDFAAVMATGGVSVSRATTRTDFTEGKQLQTGSPTDLAIVGDGMFVVRGADGQLLYSRNGQFSRDGDGHLVTAQGKVLQVQGGGDLVLKDGAFTVATDGTVTQNGQAAAKIGVVSFDDLQSLERAGGAAFSSGDDGNDVDAPTIRQGAIETSNVSTGEEMVTMMEAMRRAESGQHLMQVYDDLMGQAVTSFGQN